MLDYCVHCSCSVNTNSDPSCYDLHGVCLCTRCREQALKTKTEHMSEQRSQEGSSDVTG